MTSALERLNDKTLPQAPDSLNGYLVIMAERCGDYFTVMMKATDKHIVATWWPDLKDSWQWGHYFHGDNSEEMALADFRETALRNNNR